MQIVLTTFEHLPIRVGGLSEAATSIGESLVKLGHEPLVFMPSHGIHAESNELKTEIIDEFSIQVGSDWFLTKVYQAERKNVKLYLFSNEVLNTKEVYGDFAHQFEKIFHFSKAVPAFLNTLISKNKKKPEVFHCNDWHGLLAASYAKKFFRIPFVYTIHRLCNPQILVQLLRDKGFSDLLRPEFIHDDLYQLEPHGGFECQILNTVSLTYLEEEWERFFKQFEGKATYVWNGIDASFWDPQKLEDSKLSRLERRKKLLSKNGFKDGPLFFYVGRLDPEQKGVDHFIHAIEHVMSNGTKKKENLRFIILGSGEKYLEDKIHLLEEKYPENVKGIIGYLGREVTREYYASADFCVIPSNFEPFGLVQLEAMCLGSIPIGTKVGGINDTVIDVDGNTEKGTGKLVPPKNPGALAKAIEEGANWVFDKQDLVRKWRENGRVHATTQFTWEKAASRYAQLYQDAVSMKMSFVRYMKPY